MDILVTSFSESLIFFCFPCKKSFPILVPVQLLLPWHTPCQRLSLYSSPQLVRRLFGTGCVTYTRVINSWYICKALDLSLRLLSKLLKKGKGKAGCNTNLSFCLPATKEPIGKTGPPLRACASEGESGETLPNSISKGYKSCNYYGWRASRLFRVYYNFLFNSFQKKTLSFLNLRQH